ncbi:MAG: CcoQ/FixQ family Cbb3-type cytochrome c oxidase assembly chaperone [Xanthomonadaceae bacterium]|nr:CcoQ/FixQ family Cbb3-type cytochrome c oxidase assembly chaperone [Xanthomonadaceae bacterium]
MISGIFTIAAIVSFVGVCWWAYARSNAARFAEAARLPLAEDATPATATPVKACCCREQRS